MVAGDAERTRGPGGLNVEPPVGASVNRGEIPAGRPAAQTVKAPTLPVRSAADGAKVTRRATAADARRIAPQEGDATVPNGACTA
jgi:hypothetical protein